MKASTVTLSSGGGGRRNRRSTGQVPLSMYQAAPTEELSLEEFELFAIDRLIVLRGIEKLRISQTDRREANEKTQSFLRSHLPWDQDNEFEAQRRKDNTSHFILRLAHCQTEDQRRWFLTHESALFKFRLAKLTPEEIAAFTKANGLEFEAVGNDEKSRLAKNLQAVASANLNLGPQGAPTNMLFSGGLSFNEQQFYRIPFPQALDLVARRQVFLERGFAYVPQQQLHTIIVNRFRTSLSKALLQAKQVFPAAAKDPRLAPLLNGVHKQYVGKQFDGGAGKAVAELTPETIESVVSKSMPLCMVRLHNALKRDHKLKHQGRQQYWLFLKGAGLSMEDSIRFFQAEFSKIMSVETFNKEHLYNIRHAYGKEGKRTNYSPYSCMKIIMGSPPGGQEAHGCPYRHLEKPSLSALLGKLNITGAKQGEIMSHVDKNNYQIACQRHFEITHPGAYGRGINTDGVGNHPNAWTAASLEYHHIAAVIGAEGSASDAAGKKDNPTLGAASSAVLAAGDAIAE
jgi:DNA primase large subunit